MATYRKKIPFTISRDKGTGNEVDKHFLLVHGNWGGFGAYETCSKSCGGGAQKRYRSCNKPAPAHGGRTCAGLNYQFRACNTNKCPSKLFSYGYIYLLYRRCSLRKDALRNFTKFKGKHLCQCLFLHCLRWVYKRVTTKTSLRSK